MLMNKNKASILSQLFLLLLTLCSCIDRNGQERIEVLERTQERLEEQITLLQDSINQLRGLVKEKEEYELSWLWLYRDAIVPLSIMRTQLCKSLPLLGDLPAFSCPEPVHSCFDFPCCDGHLEECEFETVPSDEFYDKMEYLCNTSGLSYSSWFLSEEGSVSDAQDGWYKSPYSDSSYIYVEHITEKYYVKFYFFERGKKEFICETHLSM